MIDTAGQVQPHQTQENLPDDCFVCTACASGRGTPLLDRPLRRADGIGAVLTGAGPLSIGYVLIVPQGHIADIATAIRLNPAFLRFVEESLAEYQQLFGEYSVWEHGSAALEIRTSGCVAHAHLNVIPKVPLSPPLDARPMSTWSDLGEQAVAPYLLLGSSDSHLQIGPDPGISQHFRRQWASIVGQPDLWDYAVTGAQDLQWATAARYRAWDIPAPAGHGAQGGPR
jgi:hypothetical protein